METWVLIPAELSLALFPGEAEETIGALQAIGITVCSNQLILRGTCLSSLHGTVCVDNLQLPLFLDKEDVRNRFGCYDETMENGDRLIRRCNWTRFLRVSSTFSTNVNVLGSLVNGEPMYEVLRTIEPDTELLVYFEDTERNNLHICSIEDAPLAFQGTKFRSTKDILQSSPLDLSRSLMKEYKDRTASNRWNRILMTPPSESEGRTSVFCDNCFSPSDESLTDDSVRPPGGGRRTRERSLLPCVVCGKAFDRPSLLRRHMRTHTGEKPHVCNVCGKGFSTSSSLNTHKRIHSGEKPHQCPMCGKRFTASSNLYYHRMTHNKEKPHKCSLCSKSFPTPGDLKSHTYVHNGFWPYKCPICNRGFSKQTNLKNHLFLHTGDKPHTCNYCHKKFALACNLRAHRKTHDGIEKKNKDIDSGFDEPRSQKDIYDRCEIFPAENERNSQHKMNSSFSVPIPKTFMASRWSSQDLLLVGLLNQMVAYHRTDSLMNLPTPIPYKPMLLNT